MSAGIKANNDGSAAIQVGGTDYIQIGSTGNVTMPGNLTVTGAITSGAGTPYVLNQYVAPATWTKPTGLKSIKVTVVGAGGNGGAATAPGPTIAASGGGGGAGGAAIIVIPAPSIPGPVAVTAGPGTNSFGAFCSATAGSVGPTVNAPSTPIQVGSGGAGGTGSGGTINISGAAGASTLVGQAGTTTNIGGGGGNSIFGGAGALAVANNPALVTGYSATGYGSGGGGGIKVVAGNTPGGAGMPGIVIIEEFY